MCRHAGFRWGRWRSGDSLAAREGAAPVLSGRAGLFCRLCSAGLFCLFPFSVSLLFLFPLFAVMLNCRYPDPPVSACFFPFSSAPRQGDGRPRDAFVASCSRNQNTRDGTSATSLGNLFQCFTTLIIKKISSSCTWKLASKLFGTLTQE